MEKLILETTQRGVKSYHKLEHFPVIIGRALDSDVIVPDITVSGSHLKIDRNDGGFEIQCLSDENGTRLNGVKLADTPVLLATPADIRLGDFKGRILSTDVELPPTRIRPARHGWFSLLNSPCWAVFLVILTILANAVGKYISTPVTQNTLAYVNKILPVVLLLFGVALLISSVSRLSSHRWAFVPALSIASLFLLLPMLFGYVGDFLNYLLTTNWPSELIQYSTKLLLLPLLLLLYLSHVHYVKFWPAVGIAVLVSMPVTIFFISDLVDQISSRGSFSVAPSFSNSLSSMDIRVQKTQSIDEFLKESQSVLDKKVNKLLENAQE
ncbi:MAG: hypothetical protein CSB47_08310 [Proteobacteria bacterium]|nr:MAG: hypothetical protein CSB47_08310 [Pseudomonadota bacterium]